MNPKKLWTIELKNEIFGGLVPTLDPFDNTKFYLSDGWGSAYPSIKLRQFSLQDGKELNAVSVKNLVRCLYFNVDQKSLFVILDSKILHINKIDFSIIKKFEKGIPKYSDYVSSNDQDTLLLMNTYADFLSVYNYKSEKVTKKKLKTCKGIFKENDDKYLIFCPKIGSVCQYDLSRNTLNHILQTDIFYQAYNGTSDKFYFHVGKIVKSTSSTHEKIEPTHQINIYLKSDLTKKSELKFDFSFEKFIVSKDEEKIYCVNNNQILIYSLPKKQITSKIILDEKVRIAEIFDEQQLFLTYEYDHSNILTCWKLS